MFIFNSKIKEKCIINKKKTLDKRVDIVSLKLVKERISIMGMEIEKKFIPATLPKDFDKFEYKHLELEQAYLNTSPVVRIRKEDDSYYLTYKGGGMMAREEYNLPLNKKSYYHLLEKADGNVISKTRYIIPINDGKLTAELDVFHGKFQGLLLVEVEFSSVEEADAFQKPDWFGDEVTYDRHYHNSYLSKLEM